MCSPLKQPALMLRISLCAIAVIAAMPSVVAAEVTVEPVSLSIVLKDPDGEGNYGYGFGTQAGLKIGLLVRSEQHTIVDMEFNPEKKITISADGEKLTGRKDNTSTFGSKISDDGKRATLDVSAAKLPPKGPKGLTVVGELLVTTGNKTANAKVKTKLAKGAKFKINDIAVKITAAGKPQWGEEPFSATLTTSDAGGFDKIKSIKFLDDSGKEIKSSVGGTMSGSFGGGPSNVSVEYKLAKKVDTATIAIVYFTDLGTKALPVELEVGLGF